MNYYERIFESLSSHLGKNQALNEIVKIFLFRNAKFSMPDNLNKTDVFFQSNFICFLTKVHLEQDNWQLALSKYFWFGKVNHDLLRFFLNLDEENTICSIRLSGIVNHLAHPAWLKIRGQQEQYPKLQDFIEVVDFLNHKYQELKSRYFEIKKKWQWEHLDIIVFSSLYLYEVVLTQSEQEKIVIPYQIDKDTSIVKERVFNALHHLIIYAYRARKALTDKNLRTALDSRIEPFIYGENLTLYKLAEYQDFQQFVAYRIEMDLFDDFVFNAFSYQKSTSYKLLNGKLHHHFDSERYDFYAEKFGILHLYWKWRGLKYIDSNEFFDQDSFDYWVKSNHPTHIMTAYVDTYSAILLLKEIYGIESIVLSDSQSYDVFHTLFAINMQQEYYRNSFIQPFLRMDPVIKQGNIHPFEILGMLTTANYLTGGNFYPIVTGKKENKAKSMSKSWMTEGSNRLKIKQMTAILDFWTVNLNDGNQDGYLEKPFYELDGRIIQIPQRIGQQNIYSGIVNYLRKLYKNRNTLKDETNAMEKSLAELFENNNFKVFCQYMPEDNSVGEIDLIVVDKATILVIELKSTFLKTNLKEVYQYQNTSLKKASFQLDRKVKYIQENYRYFVDKPFEEVRFYSWIVDTTLEADHQWFDSHLKISLEELLIYLKGHEDFMGFYDNLDVLHDDEVAQSQLSLDGLIGKIEQNIFWKNSLSKFQKLKGKL